MRSLNVHEGLVQNADAVTTLLARGLTDASPRWASIQQETIKCLEVSLSAVFANDNSAEGARVTDIHLVLGAIRTTTPVQR